MQADLMKDKIYINKVIAEKKELFFVQDDMIVPDSKPDILNTINVTGNVCINKKEITQNKLKIEGNINTYVMYLPDSKEDNLRGLNCTIDFSENFSIPGLKEEMKAKVMNSINGINVPSNIKDKEIDAKRLAEGQILPTESKLPMDKELITLQSTLFKKKKKKGKKNRGSSHGGSSDESDSGNNSGTVSGGEDNNNSQE